MTVTLDRPVPPSASKDRDIVYLAINGFRTPQGTVQVIEDSDRVRLLPHVVRHSPDGFAWGYGGSGPLELARCILLDYLADDDRLGDVDSVYHQFLDNFVSKWPQDDGWRLEGIEIESFLEEYL